MPKSFFVATNEAGRRKWLKNFSGKMPKDGPIVGVTPEEILQVVADDLFYDYVCNMHAAHTMTTRDWTAYKHQATNGTNLGDLPVPPDPGTPPPTVPPDIFGRNIALALRIKQHPNCTEALAQDFGIIGAEIVVDPTTYQPILNLSLNAGHPHIGWPKLGMDSLELWKDWGDGKGLVFLTITTNPDFADTSPLPAPGMSAVWKYKGIYRLKDAPIGQWSDVATIGVIG